MSIMFIQYIELYIPRFKFIPPPLEGGVLWENIHTSHIFSNILTIIFILTPDVKCYFILF